MINNEADYPIHNDYLHLTIIQHLSDGSLACFFRKSLRTDNALGILFWCMWARVNKPAVWWGRGTKKPFSRFLLTHQPVESYKYPKEGKMHLCVCVFSGVHNENVIFLFLLRDK